MTNLQHIDLHDFEQYVKTRGLVDGKHLPYYTRWLQRFFAGAGSDPRLGLADAQRVFVESLERNGTPEWQVGQAARAVELYQKHYLRFRQEEAEKRRGDTQGEAKASGGLGSPATLEAAMHEARSLIRIRHYAYRTEQTYLGWLSQYGAFVEKRQLPWNTPDSARSFLCDLAIQRGVAASTQNQAFCALLFLFREVLGQDTNMVNSVRAKRGPHLPVVLTEREVVLVLAGVEGTTGLMLRLIYGSGLRVPNALACA